jgi:hypothetical protein
MIDADVTGFTSDIRFVLKVCLLLQTLNYDRNSPTEPYIQWKSILLPAEAGVAAFSQFGQIHVTGNVCDIRPALSDSDNRCPDDWATNQLHWAAARLSAWRRRQAAEAARVAQLPVDSHYPVSLLTLVAAQHRQAPIYLALFSMRFLSSLYSTAYNSSVTSATIRKDVIIRLDADLTAAIKCLPYGKTTERHT